MIRTHVLHAIARAALRTSSPLRALSIVRRVARRLTPYPDRAVAAYEAAALEPSGTCLSRAITIAARYPGARVAIGVDPARTGPFAHAWVEIDGGPLFAGDPRGAVIAIL